MINILDVKKEKELRETFIFIGTINDKNAMLKIKAKTSEEAKDLIKKYTKKFNNEIDDKSSYLFNCSVIDRLEILTKKDLED